MDMTKREVFAGDLRELYERELRIIHEDNLLKRVWSRDETLWPGEERTRARIRANLEFLNLPEKLPQILERVAAAESAACADGLTERVLVGFEIAHHLCQTLLNIHSVSPPLKCAVLDSCHPSAIRWIEAQIEIEKTLFLLVNKTGYCVGDHSLFLHFQRAIDDNLPGSSAGHFMAETEANSFLASLARQYAFRFTLELPQGIQTLFCSMVHLAGLLVALAGVEPEVIRVASREMKKAYSHSDPGVANPVCELAALLNATVAGGKRFAVVLASPRLASFAASLCKLVGGSLGKGESGLYPLPESLPCRTEVYKEKASFVVLKYGEEEDPLLARAIGELRHLGIAFLEIAIGDPLDLLRETFLWQIVTTLTASGMGIDPFEIPLVRLPRALATGMLNDFSPQNDRLHRRPRIQEGQIQLFAESGTRQEISQLNLLECLVSFFEHNQGAAYFGLFVYLDKSEQTEAKFQNLRDQLTRTLMLPVLLAWGPRSFDTYDYLFRVGAPAGLHLMVTADSEVDVPFPGANYSFGQLHHAFALGQFEALSVGGGLAVRLHLRSESAAAVSDLQSLLDRALRRVHP
jgi:transaldolase / glucose-6-phosphate isomerase